MKIQKVLEVCSVHDGCPSYPMSCRSDAALTKEGIGK